MGQNVVNEGSIKGEEKDLGKWFTKSFVHLMQILTVCMLVAGKAQPTHIGKPLY